MGRDHSVVSGWTLVIFGLQMTMLSTFSIHVRSTSWKPTWQPRPLYTYFFKRLLHSKLTVWWFTLCLHSWKLEGEFVSVRKCESKLNLCYITLNNFIAFSGYWREVLNPDVTPNQGYMNVTMDDACVVQIQRPEIWRLYEEFQKNMLWDQDHLLVDVHLSTFAELASLQKTLIVKVRWLDQ